MMNPQLKARWVEALRSGNYKQGRGRLRVLHDTDDGEIRYCCLGVLLDVVDPSKWDFESYRTGQYDGHDDPITLTADLADIGASVYGIPDDEQTILVKMNDGLNSADGTVVSAKSFAEIADYIERNL